MNTFTSKDGSVSITEEQAQRALDLFERLTNMPMSPERKMYEDALNETDPALVLLINMGVAVGKSMGLEEQAALSLFMHNPFYQHLCEVLIETYFENQIIARLNASLS